MPGKPASASPIDTSRNHAFGNRPTPPSGGSSGAKPPPTDDLTRAQIAELNARASLWRRLTHIVDTIEPVVVEVVEKFREELKKPD